jgi:hypothetical protein
MVFVLNNLLAIINMDILDDFMYMAGFDLRNK